MCREGIFGLHAVLHKFVIACCVLLSTPTTNITNELSRGCACVCGHACVFNVAVRARVRLCPRAYLRERAVMKHWTLDQND